WTVVEGVDAAQRDRHRPAGRRQSVPWTEVRAGDRALQHHHVVGDVRTVRIDVEVGDGGDQLRVVVAHRVAPEAVFVPRFVVIRGFRTERFHDRGPGMVVLAGDGD